MAKKTEKTPVMKKLYTLVALLRRHPDYKFDTTFRVGEDSLKFCLYDKKLYFEALDGESLTISWGGGYVWDGWETILEELAEIVKADIQNLHTRLGVIINGKTYPLVTYKQEGGEDSE